LSKRLRMKSNSNYNQVCKRTFQSLNMHLLRLRPFLTPLSPSHTTAPFLNSKVAISLIDGNFSTSIQKRSSKFNKPKMRSTIVKLRRKFKRIWIAQQLKVMDWA
ncbi:hypothetical protein KEM56_006251, partial [Ascosphaera pollenicola]